jgi:DNA repair protein RecN (Recombination protein N)
MIEELRIKDFAIIDHLVISLKKGFNVITGETGAGKSIIVDALGVLLKEKVISSDFVKHGKSEATVEAILIDESKEKEEVLIILKRHLSTHGKTRAYINDSIHTVQNFVKFTSQFINIHGQHEHTSLLKKENHIYFFDNVAGLTEEVQVLSDLYKKLEKLRDEVKNLKNELEINKQKLELYQYQLEEIKNAHLSEGEDKELSEKRNILKNIFKLKEIAEHTFTLLYEDKNSVYSGLSRISMNLESIARFDSQALNIKAFIDNAITQIEEAIFSLRKLKDSYESDPITLEKVEERLSLINKLKNKYGSTIKEILEYASQIEKKINSLSISEENLMEKEKQLNSLYKEVEELAKKISYMRKQKATEIEKEIKKELNFLGFNNPLFEISIKNCPLNALGIDDIEFYFSANPGEPPRPLNKIASGGELSRLMLALKCVELKLAKDKLASTTLIFDEIDAGIGGKVAQNVGKRLKDLAKHHQVICITHLPQIAVFADHHLKVNKITNKDKTTVNVSVLTGQSRKEEIARMLSGHITESSLFHAEELLENKGGS